MLHVLGIFIGLLRDRPGGEKVLRAIGAIIAAAGLWFLYAALVIAA
jgi:hypothetical protein